MQVIIMVNYNQVATACNVRDATLSSTHESGAAWGKVERTLGRHGAVAVPVVLAGL